MFKKLFTLFMICATAFILSGCNDPDPDTSLEITAINGNGTTFNYLPGATVELRHLIPGSSSPLVATGVTDANGKIVFSGLQPALYSWAIKKGCMDNAILQSGGQAYPAEGPLVAGIKNPFTTNAFKKGFVKVINNNSVQQVFKIHPTAVFNASIAPGSHYITDMVEGTNTVYYYPSLNQAAQTIVDVDILCGDTTDLIIP